MQALISLTYEMKGNPNKGKPMKRKGIKLCVIEIKFLDKASLNK